jgi:rhodanese-related sulfurtransferase
MKLISRTELKGKLDRWEDLKLVFVLGEWQYRAAHIPGSLSLPCSVSLYKSREALEGLERDDQIVVYCAGADCPASISAYYLLQRRGYKNVSRYAGGLLDWEGAGYLLEGEMVGASSKDLSP